MHKAAEIKPVVIDESLTDFETLLLAREQGYSGVALKACKGQSQALLMGAAAAEYGMFLAVQDLTCPGASFLHSAGLAARIPGVTAIEGNSRQFCPRANEGWRDEFSVNLQHYRWHRRNTCPYRAGAWTLTSAVSVSRSVTVILVTTFRCSGSRTGKSSDHVINQFFDDRFDWIKRDTFKDNNSAMF